MKKTLFTSLSSLLLPLGLYGVPTQASVGYQRSYLSAGISTASAQTSVDTLAHAREAMTPAAVNSDELGIVSAFPVSELVVIDAAVLDKHVFYRNIKPGVGIVEISADAAGLVQLTDELKKYRNLTALHIVSHAEDGVLLLGNSRITAENIKYEIEAFAALNGALREGGDLLLYGCDLARSDAGVELLDIVQQNTHLDLAASSNLTGSSIDDGDWSLEIQRGEIESGLPFSVKATADFSHVLAGTFTLSDNTVFTYRAGGETVGEVKLGATVTDNCPNAGKTYYYHSVDSTDYIGCGFMHNNGYGGTIVGLVNYYGSAYTPAFFKAVAPGTVPYADDSGTNHIEIRHRNDTSAFQLTNVVADEFSGSTVFSDVWITGYVEGGGTITSGHITTDSGTPTTFTFDSADELSNFAGVNLTKFRLSFINQTDSSVDYMRLVSFSTAPPAVSEVAGNSLEFDGTDDRAVVADAIFPDLSDDWTIEAWVKPNSLAEHNGVFDIAGGGNNGIDLLVLSGGRIEVNTTYGANPITASGVISADTWQHIALVADPTHVTDKLRLYVNGVSVPFTSLDGFVGGTFSGDFYIGSRKAGHGTPVWMDGNIDEMRVWDVARTEAEIQDYMSVEMETQPIPASLVAYYPMNGSGQILADGSVTGTADGQRGTTAGSDAADPVRSLDSPIFATNLTQAIAYTEGDAGVALNDIVVSGPNSGPITATLTLSDASAGSLSVGTFGSAMSTYTAGAGVWTVTGSVTDVNAALADTVFTPTANYDQNATISVRIRDDENTGPADGTISLNVTAVNDAPTANTNLTQTVTYTEDPGSSVALGDVVVTDVDTGDTITATFTLSDGAAGSLSTGTYGSATSTFNAGTGVWAVTGSVTDVNAALSAVAFTPVSHWDQDVTITTRIRDAADTGPADGTISLNVTGNNDAPTATNLTQTVTYTEDPGGSVALGDVVVTDVDTGDTITAIFTSSNPSAGTLTTGTFGSATSTYNAGTGVWTVTGSIGDVNAALAAVAFTPSANWDQDSTITTRIRDVANTGPADGTITLDVTAVNDAPSDIALSSSSISQSAASTGADVGTLSSTDLDNSSFTYSLVTAGSAANGTCTADSDNSSFQINGTTLETASALAAGSYNLCVQTYDGTTSFEKTLAVSVTDDVGPTVSSVTVPVDATYIAGQTLSFIVNTTENTTADTAGGTPRIALTIGSSTRYASFASGSGTSALVFSYTIQAGDNDADGIAVGALALNGGTLRDAAGNELALALNSVGSTAGVLVDTAGPTADIVVADTALIAGETSGVTITFSEAVSGFNNTDLTIANGTLSAVSSTDGGITWTATLTPSPSVTDTTNVITLDNTGVTDAAGNTGTGTTDSNNYEIDTEVPVATIVVDDTELNLGETSLVTITFNAAVTGFTNDDLTVENGSLSTVSSADGGITWTATFTPAADTDEPNNVITLDNTSVADDAGNAGTGTTDSNNFAIRTQALTLLVTSNLDTGDDETNAATLADDEADGSGLSVREALFWARAGDTITFDLDSGTAGNQGGTIVLNGNQLDVSHTGTIDGDLNDDGVPDVTISGNDANRVMNIHPNLTGVELNGLILTRGNTGSGGAGLSVGFNAGVTIRNSQITDNTVTGTANGGGGIYVLMGSNSRVINSTISGNSSFMSGGGIRSLGNNVTLALINTTVSDNVSTGAHGGGVEFDSSGGSLTLINTTVSGNAANGAGAVGGGLNISNAIASVHSSTIVGNAATDMGGGVSADGTEDFVNTVVAGNTAGVGATAGVSGSPLAAGGVADDVSGTVEVATNSFFGSNVTITTDNNSLNSQGAATLLLWDLASNGGHVFTHKPQADSALINAGSNAHLPLDIYDLDGDSNTAEALPLDATLNLRISGAAVEIGAVEGNGLPVITGTPATSVDEGSNYSFTPAASDPDGNTLVFSITNKPAWASFDTATGALTGTPTQANAGTTSGIVISVSDGEVSSSLPAFNLTVVNVNEAPAISGTPAASVSQGAAYSFTPSASDPDGDTLTFSIVNLPSWASFNTATGALTGTPTATGTTSEVVISVSDGTLSASLPSFTLTVVSTNNAPEISGSPPLEIKAGSSYNFTPTATDSDGDNLTFSITNLPAWASFDPTTGSLSGVPVEADIGSYGGIVIGVSDGKASASLPAFAVSVVTVTDPLAPVVTAPDALLLNAVGLYTPVSLRQLLGLAPAASEEEIEQALAALATDSEHGNECCTTRPEGLNTNNVLLLPPGRHEVVWKATNAAGLTGMDVQVVNLRPLVSFSKNQIAVRDSEIEVRVILNGPSPVYPLDIPYDIDNGSSALPDEHSLTAGLASFTEPGQTEVVIPVVLPEVIGAGDSELILRLDDQTPAGSPATTDLLDINAGAANRHTISIRSGNVSPAVRVQLNQGGVATSLVTPTGGLVTATAIVVDPNPDDTHSFDWSASDTSLNDSDGDVTNATWVFDPAGLDGRQRLEVAVSDSAGASAVTEMHFRVVNEWPVLDSEVDSDGDGIDDLTEGLGDSNSNGIPDYLDNMPSGNVLPQTIVVTGAYLLECEPGVLCRIGRFALMSETGGVQLLDSDIEAQPDLTVDEAFTPAGGIFDFDINGLPTPGQSVRIVIPQQAAIPVDAVYRKFQRGEWVNFVEDASNALHSTAGNPGYCPPPGSVDWQPGLIAGYLCVQLTIEDGGPNDADGLVNSAIADPGAVSSLKPVIPPVVEPTPQPPTQIKSKGGGASNAWLLALLTLGLLAAGKQRPAGNPQPRRLRRKLVAMFTLLVAALNSQASPVADNNYLRADVYQVEGSQSASDFSQGVHTDGYDIALTRYDASRTGYQLALGHQWNQRTYTELGYLDLGDVRADFMVPADADTAGLRQSMIRRYPATAAGATLVQGLTHSVSARLAIAAEAGGFIWREKIKPEGNGLDSHTRDGVDPLLGLQLRYHPNQSFGIGLSVRRIYLGGDDIDLWGVLATRAF